MLLIPVLTIEVLRWHPSVCQAAVVGVRHPLRGETIVADVVAAGPGSVRSTLRERLRSHLPSHTVPRRVEFAGAIPTTLIGKPLRRALRDQAARPLDSEETVQAGSVSNPRR